nr:MAG TPA: hypothetical protein [Caudoviricetes sp.]
MKCQVVFNIFTTFNFFGSISYAYKLSHLSLAIYLNLLEI